MDEYLLDSLMNFIDDSCKLDILFKESKTLNCIRRYQDGKEAMEFLFLLYVIEELESFPGLQYRASGAFTYPPRGL